MNELDLKLKFHCLFNQNHFALDLITLIIHYFLKVLGSTFQNVISLHRRAQEDPLGGGVEVGGVKIDFRKILFFSVSGRNFLSKVSPRRSSKGQKG